MEVEANTYLWNEWVFTSVWLVQIPLLHIQLWLSVNISYY